MENIYDILERLNRVGQPLNEGDERRWVKDPQDPASKVPAYIRKAKDASKKCCKITTTIWLTGWRFGTIINAYTH